MSSTQPRNRIAGVSPLARASARSKEEDVAKILKDADTNDDSLLSLQDRPQHKGCGRSSQHVVTSLLWGLSKIREAMRAAGAFHRRVGRSFAAVQPKPLRYALLDVDGVCILGGAEIPGSAQALATLRSSVRACRFITNQSQEPCSVVQGNLRGAGFHVGDGEIFSALRAARHFVKQRKLRPLCLLSSAAMEEFRDVPQEEPNAVVVGTAPEHMHYERLTEAMRVLQANEDDDDDDEDEEEEEEQEED
eukprot:s552_g11.t1